MKKLIILTSSFPYEGGEQFIESEITYWKKSKFDKIVILPNSYKGDLRYVPSNIDIVGYPTSRLAKLKFFILAAFSYFFYREVIYILNEKKNILKKMEIALKTVANTLLQKSRIAQQISNNNNDETYIYSYWNDVTAYGACCLKRKKKIKKIFTRMHGFDIYKERRLLSYMPLKGQFIQDMDKIYCLSESAIQYCIKTYAVPKEKLVISRLGVSIDINKIPHYCYKKGKLRILSVSYCTYVKRIDKIIEALKIFADKYNSINIEWTHIGDGDLLHKLQMQASCVEEKYANFQASFLGQKSNQKVLQLLKEQMFDVFINSSEFEGIPVSVMEAMAHGIPAIAPNIGGVSDLVKKDNGYLMSGLASVNEIVLGLESLYFNVQIEQYRKNARICIEQWFNADKNYQQFIKELDKLSNE